MPKDISNVKIVEVTHSSTISTVAYDTQEKVLFVKFKKGGVYKYLDVPEEVFTNITKLVEEKGSVGKYFAHSIKGKYTCLRS